MLESKWMWMSFKDSCLVRSELICSGPNSEPISSPPDHWQYWQSIVFSTFRTQPNDQNLY